MQAMAVLLLEMAYEGKHLKNEKADLIGCIKKLILWLRTMGVNDPVAARAYQVVWRILKTCSPSLQSQANELLADAGDAPHQARPSQGFRKPMKQPHAGIWQTPYFDNPSLATPRAVDPRLFQQRTVDPFPGAQSGTFEDFTADQALYPPAFGNPFVTSFDEGAPVVNLENLWTGPGSTGSSEIDFFNMNLYPNAHDLQPTMPPDLNQE